MTVEVALEALKVGGLPLATLLAVLFGIKRGGIDKESDQSRIDKASAKISDHELTLEKMELRHADHERRLSRVERSEKD